MKIGLIDADMMWSKRANGRRYGKWKADVFPNLVLMKLSAWHKMNGDSVEWYNDLIHYDRVYVSKVFSYTQETLYPINADEIVFGGTGYQIFRQPDGIEQFRLIPNKFKESYSVSGRYMVDYATPTKSWTFWATLPDEVEHIMPDYSIYPMVKDTAFGFLTRGCPRGCAFCHVAPKEGTKSYKVANLDEWWSGQKKICLCDPNILACKDWNDLLRQLADSKAKVDINQGMDARLLTPDKVKMLNEINLSTIHFAWDDYKQKDAVLRGLRYFKEGYKKKLEKSHKAQVFILTNFDTTHEQDLERIYTLRDMDFEPYVMVYDKKNADPFYKSLQRWVNMRAIFHKIDRFEEYDKLKAKE